MAISSIHRFVCKQYSYLACTLVCMQAEWLYRLYSGLYEVMSPVLWFVCKRNGYIACTLVYNFYVSCVVISPVHWFVC